MFGEEENGGKEVEGGSERSGGARLDGMEEGSSLVGDSVVGDDEGSKGEGERGEGSNEGVLEVEEKKRVSRRDEMNNGGKSETQAHRNLSPKQPISRRVVLVLPNSKLDLETLQSDFGTDSSNHTDEILSDFSQGHTQLPQPFQTLQRVEDLRCVLPAERNPLLVPSTVRLRRSPNLKPLDPFHLSDGLVVEEERKEGGFRERKSVRVKDVEAEVDAARREDSSWAHVDFPVL